MRGCGALSASASNARRRCAAHHGHVRQTRAPREYTLSTAYETHSDSASRVRAMLAPYRTSAASRSPALRPRLKTFPVSIHMSKRASKTAACRTCLLPRHPPAGAAPLITATSGKLGRNAGIYCRQHMRRPQTVPPVAALCSRLTGRPTQDRSHALRPCW